MVSWTLFGFLCFLNTGVFIALVVVFAQIFWRYKYQYLLFFVIYIGLIAWWATTYGSEHRKRDLPVRPCLG